MNTRLRSHARRSQGPRRLSIESLEARINPLTGKISAGLPIDLADAYKFLSSVGEAKDLGAGVAEPVDDVQCGFQQFFGGNLARQDLLFPVSFVSAIDRT